MTQHQQASAYSAERSLFDGVQRWHPGTSRHRARAAGHVSADQYATRLRERGHKVVSRCRYWMAQCPCHDDHEPSLQVSNGKGGRLLLYCHGCSASFAELMAAVGLETLKRHPCRYSLVPTSCYLCSRSKDLGVVSEQIAWVTDDRDAFRLGPPFALLELPKRAGRLVKAVAQDLMMESNMRRYLENYWLHEGPIAYGCDQAAKKHGTDRRNIRRALRSLEDHGTIECVGELEPAPGKGNGAKLYALRVAVCCPACAGGVEAAPDVARSLSSPVRRFGVEFSERPPSYRPAC